MSENIRSYLLRFRCFGLTRILMAGRVPLLTILLTVGPSLSRAEVPAQPRYTSPIVRQWAVDFLSGKRSDVIASVEDNLRSTQPDPMAARIWCDIQSQLLPLQVAWGAVKDSALKRGLGILPSIRVASHDSRYADIKALVAAKGSTLTPDEQIVLAGEQAYAGDWDAATNSIIQLLRMAPDHFRYIDSIDSWLNNEPLRSRVEAAVHSGQIPAEGLFAKYLAQRPPHGGHFYIVSIRFLQNWPGLEQDAGALIALGNDLKQLQQYDAAADRMAAADKLYPFTSDVSGVADAQIWAGKLSEAENSAAQFASRLSPPGPKREYESKLQYAKALVAAGELGRARAVLTSVDQGCGSDARCIVLKAEMERASGRSVEAAHVLSQLPGTAFDYAAQLQRALDLSNDKNHMEEAWEALKKVADSFPQRSPLYYSTAQTVLSQLGGAKAKAQRLQTIEEGLVRTPNVMSLLRDRAAALGELARPKDAIQQLNAILDMASPSEDLIALYRKLNEAMDPTKADAVMEALRTRFPEDMALWQDAADHAKDQDAKIAIWKAAIAANPTRDFGYSNLQSLYVKAKDWTSAAKITEAGTMATSAEELGYRLNMAFDTAWLVQQHLLTETIGPEELNKGNQALDLIESSFGGQTSGTLMYRSSFLDAQGDRHGAGNALYRAFQLNPDDWTIGFKLITTFITEVGRGRVMRAAYHYLDRNDYEGVRLRNLAHINTVWLSNPVEVLRLEDMLKQRAPQLYDPSFVAHANGDLGLYADDFNARFAAATSISPSDRYVNWYDISRHLAQDRESNTIRSLDADRDEVTLRLADGRIVKRGWNRYGGMPSLIQVGKAFVKANYDDAGQLLRIEQSGGQVVSFSYDEMDRVLQMADDGKILRFQYADHDKPSVIELVGVGAMHVTYKDNGDIQTLETTGGGRSVAHQITAIYEHFFQLSEILSYKRIDRLPDLGGEDPARDKLQSAYEAAHVEARLGSTQLLAYAHASVDLGGYLVNHAADAADNGSRAESVLQELIDNAADSGGSELMALEAQAIQLLVQLYRDEYPVGLPEPVWKQWISNRDWLYRHEARVARAKQVVEETERAPLQLLEHFKWLEKSFLSSEGYWRSLPDPRLQDAQSVLVRRNHEVVVGLKRGFMVFSAGHWSWYGYDSLEHRFSPNVDPDAASPGSNIRALAETDDGALWIGTAGGLVRLRGGYDQYVQRWSGPEDGIASGYINSIAATGKNVYVAAQGGASWSPDGERFQPIAALQGIEVFSLQSRYRPAAAAPDEDASVVAASADGAWLLRGKQTLHMSAEPVRDVILAEKQVIELRDDGLWSYEAPEGSASPRAHRLQNQSVERVKKINGLAILPMSATEYGVAALTDDGLSIYKDGYFSSLKVPRANRAPGVNALVSRDLRVVLLTTDGVYEVERGQAIEDNKGEVFDLLSDESHHVTYIARGSTLDVVAHEHPEHGAQLFDAISATHLALDNQGRLLANADHTIVRYEAAASTSEELFSASHQPAEEKNAQEAYPSDDTLRSLLVASDGTVWVASGASVYRWKEGMENPEEFSFYVDSAKFPGPTDMVSKVFETIDHRILAICSNESHLFKNGIALTGGVLEWDGTRFKRTTLSDKSDYWFMNSYTPIDAHTAIVGTSGSFARARDNAYAGFPELNDTSYEKLRAKTQTFLGTRGARLGDDTWLFGSAGGVLAYQNGTWFYPDRLNWLLPEDYLFKGHYGDRAVHAVATDSAGYIYVGTDRGLLIYDSGGGDSRSFLLTNQDPDISVQSIEEEKLRREQDILIASLDPKDPSLKTVHELQELKRHLQQLQERAEQHTTMDPPLTTATSEAQTADDDSRGLARVNSRPDEQQVRVQDLDESKQKYLKDILSLKSIRPGLHDAMEPDPLYVSSIKDRIAEDEVLLQYIPTSKVLFINVITHSDTRLIRVEDVSNKELNERALRSWFNLAKGHVSNPGDAVEAAFNSARPSLNEDLSWLYERLLRPAEGAMAGRKHVFVIGSGGLNYIPFAALIRDKSGSSPEYAMQHYNIGYMPSLYLLQRMKGQHTSQGSNDLVMGAPDASLPGAASEVKSVDEILKSKIPPMIGSDANAANLMKYAPKAGILHLATHGFLDAKQPQNSYLLLAKSHLTMPDAMSLALKSNDLVVLSACESGMGGDGMEYLNMAYAFSYAGAPTVLATLWQIPDVPTTKLMEEFYRNLRAGDDHFSALAKAQQWMLKQGDAERDPSAWAAFMPLGRP